MATESNHIDFQKIEGLTPFAFEKALKGLFIIGSEGNSSLKAKLQEFYDKEGYFVVENGEDEEVSLEKINKLLKAKNLKIDQHTRIDINYPQLSKNNDNNVLVKKYFQDLRRLANTSLNIHFWGGSLPSQVAESLGEGSTLITHAEAKYPAWNIFKQLSIARSIERYVNKPNITPHQQFIYDFLENFEGVTFFQVNNKVREYVAPHFLKEEKLDNLLAAFKDTQSLKILEVLEKSMNNEITEHKNEFCKTCSLNQNSIKDIHSKLISQQVQEYIKGRLVYLIIKDFEETESRINNVQSLIGKLSLNDEKNIDKKIPSEIEQTLATALLETLNKTRESTAKLIEILCHKQEEISRSQYANRIPISNKHSKGAKLSDPVNTEQAIEAIKKQLLLHTGKTGALNEAPNTKKTLGSKNSRG